jgi:hypothetical protein
LEYDNLLFNSFVTNRNSLDAGHGQRRDHTRKSSHEKFLQMNNSNRNLAWTRLLQESGERCDRAVKNFFQMQDLQGRAYWNVACANGRAFSIRIDADAHGSTSISDCAVIKRLAGVGCFERIKDAPPGWRLGR